LNLNLYTRKRFYIKTIKKKYRVLLLSILVILMTVFSLCSHSCAATGQADDKAVPRTSLSCSTLELVDINGGDTYPGDPIKAEVHISNNGGSQEDNIEVKLILSDYFKNDGKDSWQIRSLEAGREEFLSTCMKVREDITSDADAWCKLQISSDNIRSFTLPEYSLPVYGVKTFERHYIPIIGLHAVEDDIEIPIELYTGYFDTLCSTLKDFGFKTITFMDLLNHLDYGKALPEKAVIITSDDGYQDIYTNAFPILKKYDYKMTVFLVTGAIGNSDAERKMNTSFNPRTDVVRPILIWPEIIEMYDYGCEFQSHSVNHVRLGLASDEEFLYELTQSKNDIESHLGNEVLFFAWPYDNNSPGKWPLIPEAGYRGAVRYGTGIEDIRTINLNDIKRVELNSDILPKYYEGYLELIDAEIENMVDPYPEKTGEEFTLRYIIKNNSIQDIKISSLELELPDNLKLTGIGPGGYIDQLPGLSNGTYMWVSDLYEVKGEGEIDLKLRLKAIDRGKSNIKFRITTNYVYIESDDIEIDVE
jgi:peptidoglycan/xylan/chitin deacetylase (PgdA/CDA1 family)